MINIGFTGTRQGMTPEQLRTLLGILSGVGEILQGHHGDCDGADREFHTLVLALGGGVVIHPPDKDRFRAYCQYAVEEHPPKDYVPRNHDIVDDSKWLIGCPKEMTEPTDRRGGGTWATVRYGAGELAKKPPGGARKVVVILPDGSEIRRK